MIKSVTKPAVVLGTVLAMLNATSSMADVFPKTYVSNTGSDTEDCSSVVRACGSFQHALTQTAAGGEVTVVNTGNYGPFEAFRSVGITNDGAGEASVLASSQEAVLINAGVGQVISLRGLVIDGQYAASSGIFVNSASAVHIQNCVIRNFQGANSWGIAYLPDSSNSQLFVSDTIIFNKGSSSLTGGILIEPQNPSTSANLVLDRVHLENNVDGLLIDGILTSGAGSHVVVRDSVISGNAANGIHALTIAGKSPAFAFVEHSSMVNNGQSGIRADGPGATVLLNDNTITRNGAGISAVNGSQLISYGNNKNNNNVGPEGAPTGFYSQM